MSEGRRTSSADVRGRLKHPVIDADGHAVEFLPTVLEYMGEIGGPVFFERFQKEMRAGTLGYESLARSGGEHGWHGHSHEERRRRRITRTGFWGFPTGS